MGVGSRWWYTSLEESGSLILLPQGVAEPGQVTDGGGFVQSVSQLKIAPPASVTLNNGAVTHRYYRNRTYQSTVTHRYDVTTVTVTPPLRLLPLHLRNRTYQSTVTHRYYGNYRYRYPPLPLSRRYFSPLRTVTPLPTVTGYVTVTVTPPLLFTVTRRYAVTHRYNCNYRYRYTPLQL